MSTLRFRASFFSFVHHFRRPGDFVGLSWAVILLAVLLFVPDASAKFIVSNFAPEGAADPDVLISATFSQDVVTSADLATSTPSEAVPTDVFQFHPPVRGTARWHTTREVRFNPEQPLRGATAYTVKINPLLRSASGEKLTDQREYHFQTPPLSIKSARQVRFTPDRRAVISLSFTDKVNPQDLRKHVKLRAGDVPLDWTMESEVPVASPLVVTDPVSTDTLSVIIEPGLRGVDGPLGIRNRVEKKVNLTFRLTPVSMAAEWSSGRPEIRIKFSHQTYGMHGDEHITFDPPVEDVSYSWSGESILVARGDFQPETRYKAQIGAGLSNSQGMLTLTTTTLTSYVPPMAPFLEVKENSGYLGTKGTMRIPVRTAVIDKITVTARRVFDNNLSYLNVFRNPFSYYGSNPAASVEELGEIVAEKTYAVPVTRDKAVTSEIDLRDLLGSDASGVYSLSMRANTPSPDLLPDDGTYSTRRRARQALQAQVFLNLSNLGIVAKTAPTEMVVFVAALDTAQPIAGAEVVVYSNRNQLLGTAVTDSSGFARISNIPKPTNEGDGKPAVVIARSPDKKEIAALNLEESLAGMEVFSSSGREFTSDGYEAFLTPERGTYRPGEKVHIAGFVRGRDNAPPAENFPLQMVLIRPDRKEMTPEVRQTTGTGMIVYEFTVPAYAPTGRWSLQARLPGGDDVAVKDPNAYYNSYERTIGETDFLVEEFLPNRVKIEATAPEQRYSITQPLVVTVSAEEMFGQPIVNQPVTGSVTWSAAPFQPKQWPGFYFGDSERKFNEQQFGLPQKFLAKNGQTSLTITAPKSRPPAALEATVQVTINDGGRGVTRRVTRIIDPVSYYLGLKPAQETYGAPGKTREFEVVAVAPEGKLYPADDVVTGTIYRVKWNSSLERQYDGTYSFRTHRQLVDATPTSVTLSGGRGTLSWKPKSVGNYLVRLGSQGSVSHNFYVSASSWDHQPWSLEKPETAELVLDKPGYNTGETARLLIKAPFPGTVLLTLEQDRVLSSTVIAMTENTTEVPIELDGSMLPNVYAVASIIRPVQPAQQWMPHRAVGMVNIPVSAPARKLDVAINAPEEVRPGSELAVQVQLRDHTTSAPVAGNLIVWAVDEGILSLTDFETPAPGDFFSAARQLMVQTADFFSRLMPDLVSGAKTLARIGGDGMPDDSRFSPVPNDRVKTVVLWNGPVQVDASGSATLQWPVPEFMGRLRVMAMASDGRRFGNADAYTFVRSPLMVKEYLPRFAAPGDDFTAGFTIYNNSDAPMKPGLSMEIDDHLVMTSDAGMAEIPEIAPRSQHTAYVKLGADANFAGPQNISFRATAGAESFGSSVTLPVRPASPRVRESASVVIKAGERKSLSIPGQWLPGTTSATLVIGGNPTLDLASAMRYNVNYPYGCTEQIVSQVFPLLYLDDLASATLDGSFSEEGIRAMVQAGIDRIFMAQTHSGGLAMWSGGYERWNWGSVYAAHFLVEAGKAGYHVHPEYMKALLDYISDDLSSSLSSVSPTELTEKTYSAYVLMRSGRKIHQQLARLNAEKDRFTPEGRALLAAAYKEAAMPEEAMQLLQGTSGNSAQTTETATGGILSSPARETAILLMTWLSVDPESPRTHDLARRLLSLKKDDDWGSTQANAFAMLALGHYAKATATADPVSGTVTIAGQNYSFSTSAPLVLDRADLAGATVQIHCESGNAYAWYTSEGVPLSPPNDAVSNGLSVERRFLSRDNKPVSARELREGDLVVVELVISGGRTLDNVVIQDILPAGLEIENPRLATSESVDAAEESNGIIVNRMDIRDDRLLLFADLVEPYVDPDEASDEESAEKNSASPRQIYRYTARAVTPGEYTLPPVTIEAMYDPSINARSAPGALTVQNRSQQ